MRLLRHETLDLAQTRSIHAANVASRHFDFAAIDIPEAHEEFKQSRFARTRTTGNLHDLARLNMQFDIGEHLRISIREIDMACNGALKPLKRHAAFDFFGLRTLIEHIEHACARSERLLQRGAQIRHGDNRPERRHERRARHNGASEIEHAVIHQVH